MTFVKSHDEIQDLSVTIGCVNVRSLRNKTHDFVDNILEDKYDICMITETWLDGADDVIMTEATPSGFCFDHQPREQRAGGGVGLLCKQNFRPQRRPTLQKNTFEYCEWTLKIKNENILAVVIYRPPYSEHHLHSVTEFIKEFCDYQETIITSPHKIIIGGDFNIHCELFDDNDSNKFRDMLTKFTLTNHVQMPTHTGGHTLDLLITREHDDIIIHPIEARSFISDHCFIYAKTTFKSHPPKEKQITFRRLKAINLPEFKSDIEISELNDFGNKTVHEKAATYDRVLTDILDKHAPKITKKH